MAERLLVTEALDERDLLAKKINDKIGKARFIDYMRRNEETTGRARIEREAFNREAESTLQQINDLIARYQRLDAAIVASNASAKVHTSYGDFTVAAAIALRARLRGTGGARGNETDFESRLCERMKAEYELVVANVETKNRQLQTTAESMRLSILGKDSKVKEDKPLEVVESYVRENTAEMVDPLDVQKQIDALNEKRETLLRELETGIKVSNATTFIEF